MIGFENGWVRFLTVDKLEDLPQTRYTVRFGYKVAEKAIQRMIFSEDGELMAFSDAHFGVGLFMKKSVKIADLDKIDNIKQRVEWVFIGRAKAHSKEIISTSYNIFLILQVFCLCLLSIHQKI